MTTEEIFPARLRQVLRQRGMSQRQLARTVGVGDNTIHNWLTGFSTPRIWHLPELARALGVSIDWLLGVDEPLEPPPEPEPKRPAQRKRVLV